MLRALVIVLALVPTVVRAQQLTPNSFVPFTVDANRYQQIDEAVSQIPMTRQSHQMWMNIWRGLAQQAQDEAGRNVAQSRPSPAPEPKKQ